MCKIVSPKIRSCKFFDKSQVCMSITSKWFCIYIYMLIICSIRFCTEDSRVFRQDRKTQINEKVTREHIHHKSSVFEKPQCHLCKFWPSLLPTNDLLLPHIQDRRNLFDRPLPICLAFEKIHSFFESEVESIRYLWGSYTYYGRGEYSKGFLFPLWSSQKLFYHFLRCYSKQ